MRLRDRQCVFAALLLFVAYCTFLLWLAAELAATLTGIALPAVPPGLTILLLVNSWLLAWRLCMRAAFVTQAYGWRQGFWSVPRIVLGNLIAMLAARAAVSRYLQIRRTGTVRWNKTAHKFPTELPAE
jgi:adsorption protein B